MYRQFLPRGTSSGQDEQQQSQSQPADVTIVQDNAKCHPTSTSFKLRRQISQSQANTTTTEQAAEPINAAVGSSRWDATPQLDTTKKPNKDMGLKTPRRSRCDDSDSDGDIGIQGDEDPSESSSSSYEDLIACSDSILSIFPATRRAFSFTIPTTTTTRTRRRPSPPIAAVRKTWSWPGCCYGSNNPMLPGQHGRQRRRAQTREVQRTEPNQSISTVPTTVSAHTDTPMPTSAAAITNSSPSDSYSSSPSSSSTVSPINIQEDSNRISKPKAHSKLDAAEPQFQADWGQQQRPQQKELKQHMEHTTTKPKQQLEGFIIKSPPHPSYSDLAVSSRRPQLSQGGGGGGSDHGVPFPTLQQQQLKRHRSTSHLTTVVSSMTSAIQRGGRRRDPNITSATATATTSLDSLQRDHWFFQEPAPAASAEAAPPVTSDGVNEIMQSAFDNKK